MRRLLATLAKVVAWTIFSIATLVGSALWHLELPIARNGVGTWLGDVVSREIRGALVIGHVERLSPVEIIVRNVTLFDGEGHKIVFGKRLTLVPDWNALVQGRVVFSRGLLEDAQVQLIDKGDGLPTLVTTFDAQVPKPHTGGEPLNVTVENVELWQVTLSGDLLGLNGFRADDLHARGRLDIGHDVRARVDHAHATMNEPFGFPGVVDSLTGLISTKSSEGVYLRARAHRGDERVSGTVRFNAPDDRVGDRLTIRVRGRGVSVSSMLGLGYDWTPNFAVPISGKLVLQGPPSDLQITAAVETEAGNADVSGSISDARGASVTVHTKAMKLARVFADYPDVVASGHLRIDAKPDSTEPTLHAELEPLMYGELAIPGFIADGTVLDAGLRVDRLASGTAASRIGGHGMIYENGAVEMDIAASFPEIAREPNLRKAIPNASGRLDADLHISTAQIGQAKVRLSGNVGMRNLTYDNVHADRLELHGSVRGDPEHPQLNVRVSGSRVRIDEYVLGDPSLSLQGGPRDYTADGQFASAGKRTFNVHAKIHAERDTFTVDAEPIEFSVGPGSWRGALEGLRITRGKQVELGLLRLASRSQRLETRGVLRFHGEDQLQAELQDFDLAALHALIGDRLLITHGRADAHFELSGDIADPDVRLQGALRNGIVRGVTDVNALYLVAYHAGRFDADGEVDLGQRGLLRLSGSGEIDRTLADPLRALEYATYDLEFSGQGVDVGLVPRLHDAKVTGEFGCELRFVGTPDNPQLSGSVQLDQLLFPGGDPLSAVAEGGYDSGTLHAQISVADDRGTLATAGATMQLDWHSVRTDPEHVTQALLHGPWQIAGETLARRLDRMPRPIPELLPYPAAIATRFDLRKSQGATTGSIDFDLGWEDPLSVGGCAPGVRGQAGGHVALTQGTSTIEATLSAGNAKIGTLEVAFDSPLDRWIENARIDRPRVVRGSGKLDVPAMQQVPYLCDYGNGAMRASVEVDGALTDTPAFALSVDARFAPKVSRQAGRTQLKGRGCEDDPIRMRVYAKADGSQMEGSGQLEGCHGGTADLSGRMGVRWDRFRVLPAPREDSAVQALLRFDGAHLEPLLDRIPGVLNASAIARGQLNVSGTVNAVRTSGQVDVSKGQMYLVATGQELNAIEGRLSFHGDWAKLDYLQAHAGKGELAASGGFTFASLIPKRARVALRAKRFPIKREGVETAQINGSCVLDADIAGDGTRIAVELHDLSVDLPETSARTLQSLDPNPDVVIVTQAEAPRVRSYPIDFRIQGERQISVHRSDFDAEVSLDLAVHWQPPDLNVGGFISFTDGEFEVFGKRFQINSGALRFKGETEFNPDVYLAATEKPDAGGTSPVNVSVTGTLADPEVNFSSDICPGETGAITYLVSGRCAADEPDLAQESADAQDAFTSGIVSGVLTLGARSQLKTIAPRIAVGRNEAGAQRAGVGFSSETLIPKFMRKLVRRVYVEGAIAGSTDEQRASPDNNAESISPEFLIELYFPHNIVGSGRFSGQVSWGVDVLWEP